MRARAQSHSVEIKMKYSAAYTLCVLGGNDSPSAADLEKVITAAGGECDTAAAEKLCSELSAKGKLGDVIAAGKEKIYICGGGGGGGAAEEKKEEEEEEEEIDMGGGGGGGAAEEKKEEEEEEEEIDMGGGMDMFGDGGGGDDY